MDEIDSSGQDLDQNQRGGFSEAMKRKYLSIAIISLGIVAVLIFVIIAIYSFNLFTKSNLPPEIPLSRKLEEAITVSATQTPKPPEWREINQPDCFITFSYPEDWNISQDVIRDTKNHMCDFAITPANGADTSRSFYSVTISTIEVDDIGQELINRLPDHGEITEMQIDSEKATRTRSTKVQDKELTYPLVTILFAKGKKQYNLNYFETDAEHSKKAEEIISSIRFTGNEEDYANEFIHYSALYKARDAQMRVDLNTLNNATRQYMLDNSSFPTRLADLKGIYLAEIPRNPYTEEEYEYETDIKTYYVIRGRDGAGEEMIMDSRVVPTR